MWMRHVVKKNERALLMNEGDFVKVLEPGVFKAFDPFKRLSVQTARLDAPLADAALADYLRHDAPDVLAHDARPAELLRCRTKAGEEGGDVREALAEEIARHVVEAPGVNAIGVVVLHLRGLRRALLYGGLDVRR